MTVCFTDGGKPDDQKKFIDLWNDTDKLYHVIKCYLVHLINGPDSNAQLQW